MIKYKGRSCMKQYMPAKPTKRGYKVWVRADDSAYVCEFQIYTGKIGDLPEKDLGARVVRNLTEDLKNKNHRVFFDNYFTGVPLLWDLKQNQIYGCGTLKKGNKYLPNDFADDKSLTRGQYDWRMTEDKLLCLKWKDKKPKPRVISDDFLFKKNMTVPTFKRFIRVNMFTRITSHYRTQ